MKDLKDPAELQTIGDNDLTELYWQTIQQIEDLEAQKVALKAEADARLQERKRNTLQFGESDVTRFPKVYMTSVSLETARKFGAVQVQEKVNTTILQKLYKSGTKKPKKD